MAGGAWGWRGEEGAGVMDFGRALSATRPPTMLQVKLIRAAMLPTWQTAAAIAQHAGVPARTALTVLKRSATDWMLEAKLVRIDGHNQVHMFRQRRIVLVMGVSVPQDEEEVEA